MTFRNRLLSISFLAFAGLQCMQAADAEIFGGYSVTRMKPENDANHTTINGWNTSITGYATSRFGVTADFAGFYGSANTALSNAGAVSIRQYSFMAGPQVRLIHTSRIETSFRAVFGGAYGYLPGQAYNGIDQTTFAALVGSNIDVKVSRRVSMRFSPGMYLTQFGNDQTQKNFRFSVGPVFHFGGAS